MRLREGGEEVRVAEEGGEVGDCVRGDVGSAGEPVLGV